MEGGSRGGDRGEEESLITDDNKKTPSSLAKATRRWENSPLDKSCRLKRKQVHSEYADTSLYFESY